VGDASWTLRFVLLAIGLGIIAGVYLYGVSRKRRRNRLYRSQLPAWPPRSLRRFEDPEAETGTNDGAEDVPEPMDEVIAVRVRKAESLTELPVLRREQEEPGAPDTATPLVPNDAEPPPRTRAKRPRKRSQQMDLGFEEKTPADTAEEAPPLVASVAPTPSPTILALFLRPSFGPAFVGPTIVRNVNAVGMRHGDLQIFHHFGAGELKTSKPLFSLANMFEPGHFDMKRIEAFQTPGVVMFLPLPAALDGAVAFELFLNTAQRLSEGMRAQLLADPETLLEGSAIERLRRQAAVYQAQA
jgi:cell division protein ZipA